MKKKVVIFSISGDLHADRVIASLPESVEALRLNLDDPSTWSLSYLDGDVRISANTGTIGLDEIVSVFLRRVPNLDAFKKTVAPQYLEYSDFIANQKFSLFSDCLAVLDFSKPFVNSLATANKAGKAVQAKAAAAVGLATPATYIGANADDAFEFVRNVFGRGARVCSKPIANTKVRINGDEHTRFTELLDPSTLESLGSLEFCPVIFQEYAPKAYEIRATVVGDRILASRIDSQSAGAGTAVDWRRYDIPKTPHSKYELPNEVRDRVLALQRRLGLIYSSFDLVRTPDEQYIFLETNPFGQWLWIEDLTGLPITKAIADLLASPR
jgi:glutathione synthase/RimK-type ligase-like ATP-grasp enzyme